MNWPYRSSFCRTSSSIRTCRLAVLDFLGGGLTSDNEFPSFRNVILHTGLHAATHATLYAEVLHAGKTRSPFLSDGRERPQDLWATERCPKGVAPGRSVFCPRALFLPSASRI